MKPRGRGSKPVKRKDGRWQAKLYFDGGIKYLYGKTAGEVNQKIEAFKMELSLKPRLGTKDQLHSYLMSWLELQSSTWGAKTLQINTDIVKRYIIPNTPNKTLNDFTMEDGERMMRAVSIRVSANAANNARKVLYQCLERARKRRHVPFNVMQDIDKYKVESKTTEIWSRTELDWFLHSSSSKRLYAAFYLAGHTGMRKNEILGLRWRDISQESIYVRQGAKLEQGRMTLGSLKTTHSERILQISPDISAVLENHRAKQDELRSYGQEWERSGLVFCTINGKLLSIRNFDREWYKVRARAVAAYLEELELSDLDPQVKEREIQKLKDELILPPIKFHALRHSHASHLLSEGVDILTVSRRLGHAKASFTLDRYTHMLQHKGLIGMDAMRDLLDAKVEKVSQSDTL